MSYNRLAIVTLVLATLLFGLALALRHRFDPWSTNLLAGLLSSCFALFVLRDRLGGLLAFRWPSVLLASAIGVVMVLLTHLGFRVVTALVPQLHGVVEQLYLDIAQTSPPMSLMVPSILLIVAAEELVWRGVTCVLLAERYSRSRMIAASSLLYALPQLIGGSWLLLCVALLLGLVFGLQRVISGRLTESMISHAIWSVSIFGLVPLV